MSDAFEDFKKWYDGYYSSPECQQKIVLDDAMVRQNINDAASIISDIRHGRISKSEAIDKAKRLQERINNSINQK